MAETDRGAAGSAELGAYEQQMGARIESAVAYRDGGPQKPAPSVDGRTTVVVNMFGGPGAGKTVAALEATAKLKKLGYVVEYAPKYAKELVWDLNGNDAETAPPKAREGSTASRAAALPGSSGNAISS